MKNILLLTRYGPFCASSCVRYLQYLPYFQSQSIGVVVSSLLWDTYLRALFSGGSRWREVVKGYVGRILALLATRRFDVVIIEKELFPLLPAVAERLLRTMGVPYVVDYDAALFHNYDRHPCALVRWLLRRKIDVVMRNVSFLWGEVFISGVLALAHHSCRAVKIPSWPRPRFGVDHL